MISKALRYGPCLTVLPATHTRIIRAFTPQPQGMHRPLAGTNLYCLVNRGTQVWKTYPEFLAACPAETRTHDLSIASPTLYRQRHDATMWPHERFFTAEHLFNLHEEQLQMMMLLHSTVTFLSICCKAMSSFVIISISTTHNYLTVFHIYADVHYFLVAHVSNSTSVVTRNNATLVIVA